MSVLALDIGSSRIKALLAGWDGRLVEVRTTGTPRQVLEPGEQSYPPEAVFAAIEELIAGLTGDHGGHEVDTLVFSCLGTAMAPLDREGRPLGPALAPADRRPQRSPWLVDDMGMPAEELATRTGSDPAVASFLLHALWWQAEQPEVMERCHRFRSLRGYTLQELCGADAEDWSWVSRTMLADLETGDWSPAILAAAGLSRGLFPAVEPSTMSMPVRAHVAERLGLASGAVAVMGGMDNGCSLLGATGSDRSGLVNIVGTYEHMAAAAGLDDVRRVAAAAGAIVHAYVLPDQYITMTRVPVGELLTLAAARHGRRLDDLLGGLSPEPLGDPLPLQAEAVTGAVRAGSPKRDVLQRTVESATEVLVRFTEAWAALGRPTEPIAVVGGGARVDAVLQLKANLLERRLVTLDSDQGAALGALRLAAMAVRGASAAEACRLFDNPITRTIQPHPVARAT